MVGGGEVAERKVESLLEFGASVLVVSPDLSPSLLNLLDKGVIEYSRETYSSQFLKGSSMVIAATNDREANKVISSDAQNLGILVNVVDDPALCTFFMPAIVHHGDLVIGLSTSGKCPALARVLKKEVEAIIGPEYEAMADLMAAIRDEVKAKHADMEDRRAVYEIILNSGIESLLAAGLWDQALEEARKCI